MTELLVEADKFISATGNLILGLKLPNIESFTASVRDWTTIIIVFWGSVVGVTTLVTFLDVWIRGWPASGDAWDGTDGRADCLYERRWVDPSRHAKTVGLRFGGENVGMKELFELPLVKLDHQGIDSSINSHIVGLWHKFLNDGGLTPKWSCQLFSLIYNIKIEGCHKDKTK